MRVDLLAALAGSLMSFSASSALSSTSSDTSDTLKPSALAPCRLYEAPVEDEEGAAEVDRPPDASNRGELSMALNRTATQGRNRKAARRVRGRGHREAGRK